MEVKLGGKKVKLTDEAVEQTTRYEGYTEYEASDFWNVLLPPLDDYVSEDSFTSYVSLNALGIANLCLKHIEVTQGGHNSDGIILRSMSSFFLFEGFSPFEGLPEGTTKWEERFLPALKEFRLLLTNKIYVDFILVWHNKELRLLCKEPDDALSNDYIGYFNKLVDPKGNLTYAKGIAMIGEELKDFPGVSYVHDVTSEQAKISENLDDRNEDFLAVTKHVNFSYMRALLAEGVNIYHKDSEGIFNLLSHSNAFDKFLKIIGRRRSKTLLDAWGWFESKDPNAVKLRHTLEYRTK